MREIVSGIYMETLSFADRNASEMNLYLIKGSERCLLIDTGFCMEYCRKAISAMAEELGISLAMLDVLITHNHPDHTGMASWLAKQGAVIYMNPEEAEQKYNLIHGYLSDTLAQRENWRAVGVTEEDTPKLLRTLVHYGERNRREYSGGELFSFKAALPGDLLSYGNYHFRVVSLKGHTYGQIGLADEENKILFSADQVMKRIVPNVGSVNRNTALLEYYMHSLEEIKHRYQGFTVLSCHFEKITDVGKEVDRIVFHYLEKCDLMMRIVNSSQKKLTVRQVGLLAYGSPQPPVSDEEILTFTLIMAKTFSCLEYLYQEGFVSRYEAGGVLYWE